MNRQFPALRGVAIFLVVINHSITLGLAAARDAGLAVIGGLLTAELGNPARAEAIGSTIGVLAQAGGLFVADDGGITTAAEVANLVSALAAARDVQP